MNSDLKRKLLWGGIALVGLIALAKIMPDSDEATATEYAQKFRRHTVTPLLVAADESHISGWEDPYQTDEALSLLEGYKRQLEELRQKGDSLYEFAHHLVGTRQPQSVIDQCRARLEKLSEANESMAYIRQQAEDEYRQMIQKWESAASEPDQSADKRAQLEQLLADLEKTRQEALNRKKEAESGSTAYRIYNKENKRLLDKISYIQVLQEDLQKLKQEHDAARDRLIDEQGKVDPQAPEMRKINTLMGSIRSYKPYDTNLELPELEVAPEPETAPQPIVFKPDLQLAATGDLAETLLEPIVNQWLFENKATSLTGSLFEWNLKDGCKEIEVRVPEALQGEEPGKLRIRIVSVDNVGEAFTGNTADGGTDLVLTGQSLSPKATQSWLTQGKSLQQLDPENAGRSYRARICADALVFFRGDELKIDTMRASELKELPKVFSASDTARQEATSIFHFAPKDGDVTENSRLTHRQLCKMHPDKIILGVWHRDAAGNVGIYNGPTLGYAVGWDKPAVALRCLPKEYRPDASGYMPTSETISTGQYAYAYNIFLYRTTKPANDTHERLAKSLISYAGNADDSRLTALIRQQGFVPVDLGLDLKGDRKRLTNKDLPIKLLLGNAAIEDSDFGYDKETSTWVYGIRIPIPLYYGVGEEDHDAAHAGLDPDSLYYATSEALAKIRKLVAGKKACLVVQGHADPQWGKKLDVSKDSWKQNLRLSQKRAERIYESLLGSQIPDTDSLNHVTIGTSWARPASDIILSNSVEEQARALARCRRVDVFIVLPLNSQKQK